MAMIMEMSICGEPARPFMFGGHFGLWLGCDVGEGVVTRRLLV